MEITIRPTKTREIPKIYTQLFRPLRRPVYSKSIVQSVLREPGSISLIAESKKQLVGVITARRELGNLWLYSIIVKPAFRRRGIGRQLMSALVERAKKAKLKILALDMPQLPIIAFFRKLGFRLAGRIPRWYGAKALLILYKSL